MAQKKIKHTSVLQYGMGHQGEVVVPTAHCEIELELPRNLSLVGQLYLEQKLLAVHVEEHVSLFFFWFFFWLIKTR